MEISKETSKTIEELQMLEQHLQGFLAQKQNIQMELRETENALSESNKTHDDIYRILAGIMIKAEKNVLIKELEERKKILMLRVDSIEKQEKFLEDRVAKLREKINAFVKK